MLTKTHCIWLVLGNVVLKEKKKSINIGKENKLQSFSVTEELLAVKPRINDWKTFMNNIKQFIRD